MALEDIIRLHTEALIQNTEAVKLLTESLAGRTPSKAADKPKAEAKKVEEKKLDPKPGESSTASGAEESAGTEEEPIDTPVPYADVRALVLKLAANHRDAIKAINTKHGIAKLSDLLTDANDFATVSNQGKLEAIYADLQALGGE